MIHQDEENLSYFYFRKALEVYSHGFNSKAFKYPLSKLVDLFWFDGEEHCRTFCELCGVTVHSEEQVIFQKVSYKPAEKVCCFVFMYIC